MMLLRVFFAHAKLSGILIRSLCTGHCQTNRLLKIFTLCFDESYDIALSGNTPSANRQPDSKSTSGAYCRNKNASSP